MSLQATPSPRTGADSQGRRLESWKEIALHLRRDVTTVRRWERHEGLPVHRLLHRKLGSVYAYTTELDTWRDKRAPAGVTDAGGAGAGAEGGRNGTAARKDLNRLGKSSLVKSSTVRM